MFFESLTERGFKMKVCRWLVATVICLMALSLLCGLAAPSPAEYRLSVGVKVLKSWLYFEEALRVGDKRGIEEGKLCLRGIKLEGLRPIDRSVYREALAQVEVLGLGLASQKEELIFLDQLLVSLVSLWDLNPLYLPKPELSAKVKRLGEIQLEVVRKKWSLPKNFSLIHLDEYLAIRVALLGELDKNDLYSRDQVKIAIFTLFSLSRPSHFKSFDRVTLSYLEALNYRDREGSALFRAWAIDLLLEARDNFCPDFKVKFPAVNEALESLALAPVPDFI